jgi:hypothetical protein
VIIKVCQFQARQEQGERLVQIFQPGEIDKAAEFFAMGKAASPMLPEVQRYLEKLQPHPNKIFVLVNALGAGEFWGSNINGDYFPEPSLIHKGPVYGYETFYQAHPYKHHVNKDPSKSFGKVDLSVWNSDMRRVELVVVIDRLRAQQFAATDVVDKLDQGMFPDVSMGCKVPYDLCSYCLDWKKYRKAQATYDPLRHRSVGHAVLLYHKRDPIRGLSVTRDDYCVHLRTMLNKIMPDGRKVYAINDYPRFFDISFVFIGADKTAKVMAKLGSAHPGGSIYVVPSWKVAEQLGYEQPKVEKDFEKVAFEIPEIPDIPKPVEDLLSRMRTYRGLKTVKDIVHEPKMVGEDVPDPKIPENANAADRVRAMLRKKASQNKGAEIIKDVTPSQFGGKAMPAEKPGPDLPDEVLDRLGKSDLSEALSTPTSMGMILRPREFQRITIVRLGKKPLADDLDQKGDVFPPVDEVDRSVPTGSGHFSEMLKKVLLPFLEDRSILEPVAKRRMVRITICKPDDDSESEVKSKDDPFLRKISAAYNGYLEKVAGCFVGSADIVNQHADLWSAVQGSSLIDEFHKTAAGKVDPKVLFGALGGAWALSQLARYKRSRAMQGAAPPVGNLTELVAENPKLVMFLAGMGALHQQGSTIPRSILKGIKGVGKKLVAPGTAQKAEQVATRLTR